MKKIIRKFCLLLFFYSSASQAASLTVTNINLNLANLNNGGIIPTANACFGFKDFIDTATFSGVLASRRAAINRLRELLNSTSFLNNVRPFLQNTEFLSDKLLHLEIEHRNAQNNPRIDELRRMMIRINLPSGGTASGILIPIRNRFHGGGVQHHSWGILTCGHILDEIPREKKTFEAPIVPEVFTAEVNFQSNIIPAQIPIHSIKIFKTNSVRLRNNYGAAGYENLVDNVVNAQDIRGIPRYEYPADLALCYLNLTANQILEINNALLAAPANPNIQYNAGQHRISFQTINGFTCNIEFVTNAATRNAITNQINLPQNDKLNNFILGYPSYNALLTLSQAREAQMEVYPHFINPVSIAARPENNFMFFHDAPTYSGMSGGTIFNTPTHNNEINIFGVVQGYNSPDPDDDPANNVLQSRCGASFIMEGIIN